MADVSITGIKPPYQMGRIHAFNAERATRISNMKVSIDATSPKKVSILIIGSVKEKEVEGGMVRVPDVRDLNSTIKLEAGHRMYFILDDDPNGIASIDVSYKATRYTGR